MANHSVIKVVSWLYGAPWSFLARGLGIELEYRRHEYIKPTMGGIFAFDTIEHAIVFARRMEECKPGCDPRKCSHRKMRLYEAEATLLLPTPEFVSKYLNKENIAKYHTSDRQSIALVPPPLGTLLCGNLVLQRMIPETEYPKHEEPPNQPTT